MRIVLGLVAVAALMGATTAQAASDGAAVTLKAAPAKTRLIQDGAAWVCKDTVCVAGNVKSQPPVRACKRVAGELGEVAAFTFKGQELSAEALAECNASAKAA
jgi:hypothetical protein